ncbi:ATP-binding protein [Nocardiopsis sp. NPDC101807]|uniref:ATP-binding protein n=1 Tax=Nocardiopsis sp. NPDC101807 TaxID=3364339 RepID=UPI00381D7467
MNAPDTPLATGGIHGTRPTGAPRARGRRARPRTGGALRHSLLARLLASSVLVAVCSITATAWLAVQGTSESISVQQGETLAVDTRIHDTLVAYAATHPAWDGVGSTVEGLAEETGRRIALTTESHGLLADSAGGDRPLPYRTSSVVDPLAVDVTLASDLAGRIDPRAVGPFALSREDRSRLLEVAESGAACLGGTYGLAAEVEAGPSGRPAVTGDPVDDAAWVGCGLDALDEPTGSEREALAELNRLVASCLGLGEDGLPEAEFRMDGADGVPVAEPVGDGAPADEARAPREPVEERPGDSDADPGVPAVPSEEPADGGSVQAPEDEPAPPGLPEAPVAPGPEAPEPSPAPVPVAPAPSEEPSPPAPPRFDARTSACLDSGVREQLDPYVAPAALLFIDDPSEEPESGLSLSREGLLRVAGVVLLVLVLTVVVSVAVSTRLVRPVRALTDAVRRMRAGQGTARVEVRDSGEIGQLAAAFNEMAEHLARLEDQRKAMVSDVSHELRTPLSNLRGWLEAAQDGVADLDRERMGMLVGETLLLQDIIDDLQDLALADAGKLRLSPEPVEVGALVAQVVDGQRLRARTSGLRLVVEAEDVVAVVDRTRLRQIVGNLVGNALRHTPAPGTVAVRVRRADGAAGPPGGPLRNGDVVVEVEDTGVGIAREDLPHVFDRFWRADKSRNRRTGGSGLGLAIVRGLVELHGGSVSVESVRGEGTVFTVRLPPAGPPDRPEPPGPSAS